MAQSGLWRDLVDVEHLAAVLGDLAGEHLAAPMARPPCGIVLVAHGLHLGHVRLADALVAALVEEDAGVVAVVDDGVAHDLDALLPAAAVDVALGVAGGHGLHQADAVAGFDVLLRRRDVHPAHQVGVALDHQAVAEVAEPRRHVDADGGPLVGGALGVAVHLDDAVVELDHAVGELRLAEAGAGGDGVD